ncbi:MAG: N(6)-L-threonylcarbamoyladenine synthase Kae1 [Candidatus Aenigmarchaeota archaeon]|nr:N(6)-L-threonylcarbamoyladenine synthase Kae1 [Candidatus Aenigmarchaeota archaeon]
MICLGIESTAHTFGVGIADEKGNILSDEKDTYKSKEGWGIIPIESAEHHREVADSLIQKALAAASLEMKDIDLISFSQGPGLAPCLYAGLNKTMELSRNFSIPYIGVNHCVAHIEIGKIYAEQKDPVVVFTSGANTQIISFNNGRYRIFGETMDVGLGNALDKFGRSAGIGFPAGPKIEELGRSGKWIELPYVVKGMDLSFSGIVTEASKRLEKGCRLEDVCFSIQESMFSMVTEVTERAIAHLGKEEVMLTGGVAANRFLQEKLRIMSEERKARFSACPMKLAGDNGAMIAWTGILAHKSGYKSEKGKILPRWRADDMEISWMK